MPTIDISMPIKSIKTITLTITKDGVAIPFSGCTPTLTLKKDYSDTTKTMVLVGSVGGAEDNVLSFTTTVAGTTVIPDKYKGDIRITNGTTIDNRDIKLDWTFEPIVGD